MFDLQEGYLKGNDSTEVCAFLPFCLSSFPQPGTDVMVGAPATLLGHEVIP